MQSTSVAYQTAVVQPSRSSVAKILFGVYDVTAQGDATVTTNGSQPFTNGNTIKGDIRNQDYKAASLEDDYFSLDGSFYLMPDDANPNQDILGWWSYLMSDASGNLSRTDTINFVGKVAGSLVENANIFRYGGGNPTTLLSPSSGSWVEDATSVYGRLSSLSGAPYAQIINTVNGGYGEQCFSFNLIDHMRRKHGMIVDVAWLKANITNLMCNWWGYGSSPTGNKATLTTWYVLGNTWESGITHGLGTVTKITRSVTPAEVPNRIDANGFVHFLAYADPSNGTIASTINTDYVELLVTLAPPTVTINFASPHSSLGFGAFFGSGEYCTDFDMTFFNGATQIGYQSITGNTQQDVNISYNVTNYNKIVIRFLKTRNPYRYARLMEFQFGLEEVFDSDLLTAATVVEEVDPSNAALSFNTLKFTVLNLDQRFNMLNPSGIFAFLQKRQKIVARSGLLVGDNYEWVDMGTYYLSDWKNSTSITASLEATDAIGLLDKTVYRSSPFWVNAPVETLLRHILTDAGGFSLQISPSAQAEVINGYIPVKSHRAALADVLVASRNVMRTERSGILNVTKATYATADATVDYDTMINSPSIEQKPLISSVEAKEFTYALDSATTQLTQTTFPLTGINTVTVDYGCAASNAAVVVTGGTVVGTPTYSAVSVKLQINGTGTVTVTVNGRKYIETSRPVTSSVTLAAGDVPQTATIAENKMIVGNGAAVSAYILAYFQKRISQKFDYWSNPAIQSGDNVSVQTMFGTSYAGMLERQEITIAPNLKARLEVTG